MSWNDDIDSLGIRYDDGSWLLYAGYDDSRIFEIVTTNSKTGAIFHDYVIGSIDTDTSQVVDNWGTDIGVAFDDVSRWMHWNPDLSEQQSKQIGELEATIRQAKQRYEPLIEENKKLHKQIGELEQHNEKMRNTLEGVMHWKSCGGVMQRKIEFLILEGKNFVCQEGEVTDELSDLLADIKSKSEVKK